MLFYPFVPSFYFLRLAVFLAGLISDTPLMASSKSMSSFKSPVCFYGFVFIFKKLYHSLFNFESSFAAVCEPAAAALVR